MSSIYLQKETSSLLEWEKITFDVSFTDNIATVDTTNSDVEIHVYLNPNKQWTSNYSQNYWIRVVDYNATVQNVVTWDSTDPYTYTITIPQGTNSLFGWYIQIRATIPRWTKLKALLQKIVGSVREIDEIGQGAEIYGKNSAGTGDCSLAKQTYKNPLAGQCSGRLYSRSSTGNISATTATTTTQSNDLFVVTPSTGKIKVLKSGNYLIEASAYAYTGFTAEDRFDFRVQVDGTNYASLFRRERMSSTYQIIFMSCALEITANQELNIAVTNYEAARGIVVSAAMTMLQVTKVN